MSSLTLAACRSACLLIILLLGFSSPSSANGPNDNFPDAQTQLKKMGIDVTPDELVAIANDQSVNVDVRTLAGIALGDLRDDAYEDSLIRLLSDPISGVRYGAVLGLRNMGSGKAEDQFIYLLKTDSSPSLRQTLISILAESASPGAVDAIFNVSIDPIAHPSTRQNALFAISLLHKAGFEVLEGRESLLATMHADSSPNLRGLALHLSAQAGNEKIALSLAETAADIQLEDWVRKEVVTDLQNMTGEEFGYFSESGGRLSREVRLEALGRITDWHVENSESALEESEMD